jgi:hypothetical protein
MIFLTLFGMTGPVLEKRWKGKKAGEARLFPLPPTTMLCVIPNKVRNPNSVIVKLINNIIGTLA